MKTLLATVMAAFVLGAAPAWADDDHRHRHGDGRGKHAEKHWKKAHKHWAKHHRHVDRHVVVHEYYSPPPRVVYHPAPRVVHHQHVVVTPVAPPPGIHVVMPNVYFPF